MGEPAEFRAFKNLDDVIAQMKLDEVEDAPLITPVNYAKIRERLTPQLVYYRIRTKQLPTYTCPCGRKCISIEEADILFGFKDNPKKKTQ